MKMINHGLPALLTHEYWFTMVNEFCDHGLTTNTKILKHGLPALLGHHELV